MAAPKRHRHRWWWAEGVTRHVVCLDCGLGKHGDEARAIIARGRPAWHRGTATGGSAGRTVREGGKVRLFGIGSKAYNREHAVNPRTGMPRR